MKNPRSSVRNKFAIILSVLLICPILSFSVSAANNIESFESSVITPILQEKMDENPQGTIRTAILLKDIDTNEAIASGLVPDYQTRISALSELNETYTAPNDTIRTIELKRAAFNICYEPYTTLFETNFLNPEEKIYCSIYMPIVIACLSNDRIQELSTLNIVQFIDYYEEIIEEHDISTFASSTPYTIEENISYINAEALRNCMPQNTYVKVGMIEGTKPEHRALFNGKNIIHHYPNATTGTHASAVLEILVSVAPYATFYCANRSSSSTGSSATSWISELDWLIANGVNVVNISSTISIYATDSPNSYNTSAYYIDQFIYTYDITLVKSAGNSGSTGVTSGGVAYNIIAVGNFNACNGCMESSSSYANETGVYPAKPDISAPGVFKFPDGGSSSGTSLSAPVITGIIALMMSCNTRYLTNTPLIKATLACSTLDDYSFLMGNDSTLAYGAGVIDAEKVRQCVFSTNFINGTMPASLFTSRYHELNLTAGLTYRIALVYEKPITSTEHFFLPTLGLTISNDAGEGYEYCTGMYQNIKIIEFTAVEGLTYEALIMRYADTGTEDTVGTIAPYSLVWCAQ